VANSCVQSSLQGGKRELGLISRLTRILLSVLICGYAVYLAIDLSKQIVHTQWDFKIYYHAAKAYYSGLDPYQTYNLNLVAESEIKLPFAYPPASLHLFRGFNALDYPAARRVWLYLKLAVLAALLVIWRRYFVPDGGLILFIPFIILAFDAAVYFDLKAGNVSIFEQFLLWTAFLAFLRQKPFVFFLLIVVASIFKLITIAFLLLLLVSENRRQRWRWMAGAAAGVLLLFAINYMPDPHLFDGYLATIQNIDERAMNYNYAALPFFLDVCRELAAQKLINLPGWAPYASYATMVAVVLLVTARAMGWRKWREVAKDRRLLVFTTCVVFALIAPRLKCYSLILLLPPSYYIIRKNVGLRIFPFAFVLLILTVHRPLPQALTINHFSYYYPLFMVFMVWLIYMHYLSGLVKSAFRTEAPLGTAVPLPDTDSPSPS
jgi:hypothetical protein